MVVSLPSVLHGGKLSQSGSLIVHTEHAGLVSQANSASLLVSSTQHLQQVLMKQKFESKQAEKKLE